MNSCNKNHHKIIYEGDLCPVCNERELLDETLDARTDINFENILELFKDFESLRRDVQEIKIYLGLSKKRFKAPWWPVFNKADTNNAFTPKVEGKAVVVPDDE